MQNYLLCHRDLLEEPICGRTGDLEKKSILFLTFFYGIFLFFEQLNF